MDIHDYIRDKITKLRLHKNISESKLSTELGHNRSYFSNINKAKTIPSMEALVDICDYFDISVSEFFGDFISEVPACKLPEQKRLIESILEKTSGMPQEEIFLLAELIDCVSEADMARLAVLIKEIQKRKK